MSKNNLEAKNIISRFIRVPVEEISPYTVIDKNALPGSVLVHRMRSELKKAGFDVNWDEISTYGDLIGGGAIEASETVVDESNGKHFSATPAQAGAALVSIGIDVEGIESMPTADDFFADQFYVDNFSDSERTYCSRKSDPRSCFAGLFSAKEALYKASNGAVGRAFNKIEVWHDNGKPVTDVGEISISHQQQLGIVVAVALYPSRSIANLGAAEAATIDSELVRSEPVKINTLVDKKRFSWSSAMGVLAFWGLLGLVVFILFSSGFLPIVEF